MKIRAAVAAGKPLEVTEVDLRGPRDDKIVLRLVADIRPG